MTSREEITAKVISKISEVDAAQWDACANPSDARNQKPFPFNPFVSHAFLHALESSGSTTAHTGWAPHHILAEDGDGILQGAIFMYLKNHSYGEYVFDYGWANAYERAGGNYYPKLQVSVPFTPATGRRLLARPGPNMRETQTRLVGATIQVAKKLNISGVHFTFMLEDEWDHMGDLGLLQRTDQQFHWLNRGYDTFDDFLADLTSRKRKNLKKERQNALENNITIERLTGSDIQEHHWDAFYDFYIDTGSRKWGRPYLTRKFFSLIGETMPNHVLLVMCKRGGRYIAGAINFIGGDTLFGRNWGCIEDHRFLHFEACYYQAIDFAIERGLGRVEAGAQGAHKLARGYVPARTYSAHYLADAGLRNAVERFLDEERRHIDSDIMYLSEHAPFRRHPNGHLQ